MNTVQLLTTNEAADLLGISAREIRHLIAVGTLPASKHGRDWWISPADVKAASKRKYQGRGRKGAQPKP
jgi:excisionase family DNA binding protein